MALNNRMRRILMTAAAAHARDHELTWRGMGQNMLNAGGDTVAVNPANIASALRVRHKMPYRAARCRIHYRVYNPKPLSTPTRIADTKFTGQQGKLYYACAFEANFLNSISGLAPRIPVTFKYGRNYGLFDEADWDPAEYYMISDICEVGDVIGRYLEPGEYFGIHNVIQVPLGVPGSNIPDGKFVSNANMRYYGSRGLATSMINGVDGGISDYAVNGNTYAGVTTSRAGVAGQVQASMIEWEVPKTTISLFGIGDSIGQDQKEGYGQGTAADGDCAGDADGNTAFFMRAAARHGVAAVNVSRGSDGYKYLITPEYWTGRRQLLQRANPTCVDLLCFMNDIQSFTAPGAGANWSAISSYAFGTLCIANGNCYMMTGKAGVSASGGSGPSGTGAGILDGTCTWIYLGPIYGTGTKDRAYTCFSAMARANKQVHNVVPGAKIRNLVPFTKTTSNDGWATPEGQTVTAEYRYDGCRGVLIDLMFDPVKMRAAFNTGGLIDLRSAVEDLATGKHLTNGTASYMTDDGTHLTSIGQLAASLLYPPPPEA